MNTRIPVANNRRGRRGSEIIEFAIFAVFMVPLFIWMFITGMNLLRFIQCTEIVRDIGVQYVGGVDYSTYTAQEVAQVLAAGYGLNIGSTFSGNDSTNDANGGNAWIVISQIMYIGSNSCSALPTGTTCTNENQYVFYRQMDFGNKSLQFNGTQVQSAFGTFNATTNSSGYVQNYMTDSKAQCPNMANFMQTQLSDGQYAYVVEGFFADPNLGFSSYPAGGIYVREFF